MKNRDFITELLKFDMEADIIVLTKEVDIHDVNGEPIPGIKFGTLSGSDGETQNVLAIVGDYNKYGADKAAAAPEAKE